MASAEPDTPRRFELKFPATREGFAHGFDELRLALDDFQLEPGTRLAVELVFEEVVSNVVRHGARPGAEPRVLLSVVLEGETIRLLFLDDGPPFDPRERPAPPRPADLERAPAGGRGLPLIRSVSSAVEYLRTPEGQNRLTVTLPKMQRATRD